MTARSAVASPSASVDIAAIATAVASAVPNTSGVRDACAAAINGACTGPTGTLFLTIESQSSAAIQDECGQFGAIRDVVIPDVTPVYAGELTGATSYVIQSLVANKYIVLHGFTVTSDANTTLQWLSGATTLSNAHEPSDFKWEVSPGSLQTFRCNLEEALILTSSNASAKLRVTAHLTVVDF